MKNSQLMLFCILFLSFAISRTINQNQTLPLISEPDDISYIEGSTGNYIDWYVSFDRPLHYSVQKNNTVLDLGGGNLGSTSGNITICVDGLSVGNWHYLLIVDDYGDNVAMDLVIVKVNPSGVPFMVSILSVIIIISVLLVLLIWQTKMSRMKKVM